MISMLFLNKTLFEVFDYISLLAIYSEPLCATYASFGGGGSQISFPYATGWVCIKWVYRRFIDDLTVFRLAFADIVVINLQYQKT